MSVTPVAPVTPAQPVGTSTVTTTATSTNWFNALIGNGYLVSLIAVVGLIVLMGLGKLSVTEGLPPVLVLAGVHLGSSVASP